MISLKTFIVTLAMYCFNTVAQDIITSDGQSMGAKSIFMEVCMENMSEKRPDAGAPYSVYDFCNCMADELLPTFTKSQINYYFTQDHLDEMLTDSASRYIIVNCVVKNISFDSIVSLPPPLIIESMTLKENEPLVDSIVIICDYESKFNSIKEQRLIYFAKENDWDEKKIKEVYSKIKFLEFDQRRYYGGYSGYSRNDLLAIIEYFEAMSQEELQQSEVRYEKIILTNFEEEINYSIKKAGGLIQ